MADEKKIIVDEDWKSQAQKEKEQLKAQEEASKKDGSDKGPMEMPPADFLGLVSILASQAFYALGVIRSAADKDKEIEPDLPMARYHIDLLAMLEEKCKGNLTREEQAVLTETLSQLRMVFVKLSM
ncbi:MAG: DUF1844 domain-containing protein [Anaerohalosphaeraceae bacterium]|nr:DUF1844 domain-containing protein [Anaerohalosphaeraceae bacterium]